jgi:hypothetical protein
MRNHLKSVLVGLVMGLVGLTLWLTTEGIETPVITLSKVGLVLLVLGALEVVISGLALASRSTRHPGGDR